MYSLYGEIMTKKELIEFSANAINKVVESFERLSEK